MLSPGSLLRSPRGVFAAAALAGALAAAPSAASAAGPNPFWAPGNSVYQVGDQCGYEGKTGTGPNTASWVSWYTDPQAGYPAVGDKYWIRLDAMGMGQTCAGGMSDIATELALPANTSLAIDLQSQNANDRVRCFYVGLDNQVKEVTNFTWRVQDPPMSGWWCDATKMPPRSANGYHLGQRLIGPGEEFFVVVPVVTTKRLAGMAGGEATQATAKLTSGINSPASPFQWITVFDRPALVGYPEGAASELTNTTAKTTSVLSSYWRKGNAYVDLGFANGDFAVTAGPIAIDGQWPHYTVAQTWTGLTPGTDYKFRLRFVDEQGAQTTGDAKTFRTTGTKPVTPPPTTPGTPGGGGGTGGGGGGTAPPPAPDPGAPSKPGGEKPGGGGGGGGTPAPGGGTVTPAPSGGDAGTRPTVPAGTGPTSPGAILPAARLVAGAKLGALLKPAGLGVTVSCVTACDAKVTLKVDAATARRLGLGKRATVIATGSGRSAKGGTVRVTLKPTAAAKRKLKRAKRLKATLTVQTAGGTPVGSTVTLAR